MFYNRHLPPQKHQNPDQLSGANQAKQAHNLYLISFETAPHVLLLEKVSHLTGYRKALTRVFVGLKNPTQSPVHSQKHIHLVLRVATNLKIGQWNYDLRGEIGMEIEA